MAKFFNQKTVVDGITFDSKMESEYYKHLKQMKAEGFVKEIELQPRYLLIPSYQKKGKTVRKMEYIADFLITYKDGFQLVVDVKGMLTDSFKLKQKLFDYLYPKIELRLITEHNGKWINLNDKPKRKKTLKKVGKQRGERKEKRNLQVY